VEISIRNFGTDTQSSIPVELLVDGVVVASEVYPGTLNANETDTFTFSQTVDLSTQGQTYEITARSNLSGDEFPANNSFSKNVTHLLSDDVGVIEVINPTSGEGLGNETITVRIRNFGALTQSNFDVSYSIDGTPPVVETF